MDLVSPRHSCCALLNFRPFSKRGPALSGIPKRSSSRKSVVNLAMLLLRRNLNVSDAVALSKRLADFFTRKGQRPCPLACARVGQYDFKSRPDPILAQNLHLDPNSYSK